MEDRKKIICQVARLSSTLDELSYGVDDRDPAQYTEDYRSRHAHALKGSYTPEEVQDMLLKIMGIGEQLITSIDLTPDETLEYMDMVSIEAENLVKL